MSEWKEFKLDELADIYNHIRVPLSKMERSKRKGPYPYYGASGIVDYIDDYLFDGEYILISEDGENLKSRQTPIAFKAIGKFWVNNHAHIIKGKKDYLNDLIIYYFQNLDLNPFITGAVQPKLNKANLLSIPIYLPELEAEQKAIAEVLSSLDDKIDLLHRQNKTLEALAETLFRQWFIEEARDNWEEGTLNDLIELFYGKGLKKSERTGAGFPVVGSNGIIDFHSEYLVKGPGIVIGRKGTLGKAIYIEENFYPIDTTYYVKSKRNTTDLYFEYFLLKNINFEEMNTDSAVPGLNRNIALNVELKIPLGELIDQFNKFAKHIFEKRSINKFQIRTLEKLRDTLLPKLMSGEVRVKTRTALSHTPHTKNQLIGDNRK